MQIENLVTNFFSYQTYLSLQEGIYKRDANSLASWLDSTEGFSDIAQFALSYQLSEVSYSSSETSFSYANQNRSIAMCVRSTNNISMRIENLSLDFTFSAEVLGLTAEDFQSTGGHPIQLKINLQESDIHISNKINTQLQKKVKKPEEIISELVKAILDVLSKKGNKTISLRLDTEALQALASLGETKDVIGSILALVSLINSKKMAQEASTHYEIMVSGKGKPVLDVENQTECDASQTNVDMTITINPPQVNNQEIVASSSAITTEMPDSIHADIAV